jgi:hypothetical protein
MRTWRWYSKVLLGLALAAFAYWVWPTAWVHCTTFFPGSAGPPEMVSARVNRFTGRTEVLSPLGWCDGITLVEDYGDRDGPLLALVGHQYPAAERAKARAKLPPFERFKAEAQDAQRHRGR